MGWGSSTWRGGGQKVRYVPRNPGNQTFLAGYPGILPGYPGSARKVWEKNVWVQFLAPNCKPHRLSGPVSRDTARLSQRYPSIACYGVFGVSTWPIWCDTPSPFSERFPLAEHAWQMGAIPPSAILARKGISRYGGVSRTGPLSPQRKKWNIRLSVRIQYNFDCFQVRFGLIVSTLWIGSEYGLVTLLHESASESQTQNNAWTAPW